MTKYTLVPERPTKEFGTIGIEELLTADVSKRIGGKWWLRDNGKQSTAPNLKLQNCIVAAEELLLKNLKEGTLLAHAYAEGTGQLHRIPQEYWHEDSAAVSLRGRIFEISMGQMFSAVFDRSPVVVLQSQALRWLADRNIYAIDPFFPAGLRHAADTRKPQPRRQAKYSWSQFREHAVELMRVNGAFSGSWKLARLEDEMKLWCGEQWREEPSTRMIREHAKWAAVEFLSRLEAGDLGN